MQIQLTDAGKRFNYDWIFRHINFTFEANKSYAITGPNGSGKSTLLQSIAGALLINEGGITYHINETTVDPESVYKHISIAAPYLELIEEMTANEMIEFHGQFKKWNLSKSEILEKVGLIAAANKQIRYFSSGMKQRLKLAQAFFSDTEMLLLDEPCTNLDEMGIGLYKELLQHHCNNRITIIASNDRTEYGNCDQVINLANYK